MEPAVATVVDLYGTVHRQLRELIDGMDTEALNWSPGPEMNSLAVLVTHTVASELDTLTFVRDVGNDRDRDAEFRTRTPDVSELMACLDRGDVNLVEHGKAITPSQLEIMRERPGRDSQVGLHWLINNCGHSREHLGHAQMTKLLWEQRGGYSVLQKA
jgi:hypothetical protein